MYHLKFEEKLEDNGRRTIRDEAGGRIGSQNPMRFRSQSHVVGGVRPVKFFVIKNTPCRAGPDDKVN